MGGGSSDSTSEIRYAPYVEETHSRFLGNLEAAVGRAISNSGYAGLVSIPVDVGFFGSGSMGDYSALFDLFETHVLSLDLDTIWNRIYNDVMTGPETNNLVVAQSILMQDELETVSFPEFTSGMRDIGSVNSSSFVLGRAILQDGKTKAVNKYAAELRYRLLPTVQSRYDAFVSWHSGIVVQFADMLKYYFTIKEGIQTTNYLLHDREHRWELDMLTYMGSGLGALQGAMKTASSGPQLSTGQKVLGGAMSGAAMGTSTGNPWGAAIGAVVGGVAGLLM